MTTLQQRAAPRRSSGVAAVDLDRVEKRFGDVTAVAGISLRIHPGEVVALLGPNGAGKTSTVDMVLGLSDPTVGAVRVYGMNPRDAVAHGLVAAVMQNGGLLKEYTVEETVRVVASLFAGARPIEEVLARAGLAAIRRRRVGKCSGGEQQRLRFAIALLPDPELMVLDEPTTGMDVAGRHEFWSAIREDAEHGRTVIFATHYLEEADAFADRIVFLSHGRVVADGTAAQGKALASGRVLRATLPHGANGSGLAASLRQVGAESVEVRGDALVVHGSDTDGVARYLLTRTQARDVEISSSDLETAFLALTGDHTEGSDR